MIKLPNTLKMIAYILAAMVPLSIAFYFAFRVAMPEATASFARELFNIEPEIIYTPPEIITRYDTVTRLDTAWYPSPPETVTVPPRVVVHVDTFTVVVDCPAPDFSPTHGVSVLLSPYGWGDTLRVGGFTFEPLDSSLIRRDWQASYFAMGPIKSMRFVGDTIPPVFDFYPQPPPPCGFGCSLKKYIIGSAAGAAIATAACAASGR
jgi:hypothetical protein